MALKVKAQEKLQKIGKYEGTYRYVMMPELYTALTQDKVIKEVALRSGVRKGVVQITCYDRDGKEVKRVTSTDEGNVEDPELENGENSGSGQNGGNTGGGQSSNTGDNNGGGEPNPDGSTED